MDAIGKIGDHLHITCSIHIIASFSSGNPLTEADQRATLDVVVSAARALLRGNAPHARCVLGMARRCRGDDRSPSPRRRHHPTNNGDCRRTAGRSLASGRPEQVLISPVVIAAHLGAPG